MQVLPRVFKLWPWIDPDLFYIKVKFGYICFCMGESDFFGNYCSLRSQSHLKHSGKWVNEVEWVSKVKVILWPWPKVIQISKLNVWLWLVYSGERFRASWPSCFLYYVCYKAVLSILLNFGFCYFSEEPIHVDPGGFVFFSFYFLYVSFLYVIIS